MKQTISFVLKHKLSHLESLIVLYVREIAWVRDEVDLYVEFGVTL